MRPGRVLVDFGPRRRIALLVATYHAVPAALRRLRPDREGAARRAAGDLAQTWFRWPDRDGDRRGLERRGRTPDQWLGEPGVARGRWTSGISRRAAINRLPSSMIASL